MNKIILVIALLLSFISTAFAQGGHNHNHAPGVGTKEMLDIAIGKKIVAKPYIQAMGSVNEEAQYYFWQAMGFWYGFDWLDAARSLKMALKIEPNFLPAKAFLVTNLAELGLTEEIYAELPEASSTAGIKKLNTKFQAFTKVLQKQMLAKTGGEERAFFNELSQFQRAYPSDANAAAMLAYNFHAQVGGLSNAISILKSVVANEENHFGAHHYLTHLYEASAQYESAFKHGQEFAKRAQIIPHGWHMAGHIAGRIKSDKGPWKVAIGYFEKAHTLHMQWSKDFHAKPEADWHYQHNLHLMSVAYFADHNTEKAAMYSKMACDLGMSGMYDCFNHADILINQQKFDEALLALKTIQSNGMNMQNAVMQAMAQIMTAEILMVTGKVSTPNELGKTLDMNIIKASNDRLVFQRYNRMVNLVRVMFAPEQMKQKALTSLLEEDFSKNFAAAGFDTWANAFLVAENYNIYLQLACQPKAAEQLIGLIQKHIDADYRTENNNFSCRTQ